MSNFLDLRCPHCGETNPIDIQATVWLRVTENGTDADADLSGNGDHEFTRESWTVCGECGEGGKLRHFETGGAP
jgi:hypothetical protein